jgi:hypothetical protein
MAAIPRRASLRGVSWVASLWEPDELVAAVPLVDALLLADVDELEEAILSTQFTFGDVQAIVEATVLALVLIPVEAATVPVAVGTLKFMTPADN